MVCAKHWQQKNKRLEPVFVVCLIKESNMLVLATQAWILEVAFESKRSMPYMQAGIRYGPGTMPFVQSRNICSI